MRLSLLQVTIVLACKGAWAQHKNGALSPGPECACSELIATNPGATLLPNATHFVTQKLHVWDKRSDQQPACIFLPKAADDVSQALSILTTCDAEFAIRGGGHMNVRINQHPEAKALTVTTVPWLQ